MDGKVRDEKAVEALVRNMAEALDLPVRQEWLPGVAQQLAITLQMASLIESVELADDAQPAPVYRL